MLGRKGAAETANGIVAFGNGYWGVGKRNGVLHMSLHMGSLPQVVLFPPQHPPHVAILPLGTGNDLARVLGWGKGYEDEDIEEILKDVEHAQLTMLDRWHVQVEHRRYLGVRRRGRDLTMNNYLGVGCGAGVALNFHRQRESKPLLFTSRIVNKVGVAMVEAMVEARLLFMFPLPLPPGVVPWVWSSRCVGTILQELAA